MVKLSTSMESTGTEDYYSYFRNVKTDMVKPATAVDHPASMYPSHLDHLHMDRYVPIRFLYRLADNSDSSYRHFADGLKASLAKALVLFYPVAGAVIKTSDPHHPRMILCDDRGVPFTEAYKDEVMDDIVKAHEPLIPLSGFEPAGLSPNEQCKEIADSGNPCFLVQVTRFKCGGVSLAISWNHLLADMTGTMLLLRAWADILCTGETIIVPEVDRTVLSPRHETEGEPTAPPPLTEEEKAKIELVLNSKFIMKVLHIKKEKIDEVKKAALQDGVDVSTMDCLSAHLWRCIAGYYAKSGISDTTIFTTAVEGRAKMGGALSSHYLGNVVVPAFVRDVPASEILSKPLAYAASLIRKSIRAISQETYWNIIDQMDLANPWKTAINRTDYQLSVVSWIRFRIFELDFGLGQPVAISINLPAHLCRKGQCIILPSSLGPGNFDVVFFAAPSTMEDLFADQEFTSLS